MRRLLLASLLLAGCGGNADPIPPTASMPVPIDDSPQRGPVDAWVTVVEFGDFQCPACKAETPVLTDALAPYGDDVRLVYKHFPLSQIHAYARPAAIAAECAREGGAFWPMYDRLYARSPQLDDASLAGAAAEANVPDLAAWQACFSAQAPAPRVDEDFDLGLAMGVQGTPTVVVNGLAWPDIRPSETDLRAAIDHALAVAKASGIARDRYYDTAILGR